MTSSASSPRRVITRVGEYDGGTSLIVAPTQLDRATPAEARRVLEEWLEFFAESSPIRRIELASRVPQRLLDALAGQTELESLTVKWGSYSDLTVLAGLPRLREVTLGGAGRVIDLEPLTRLPELEVLDLGQPFSADPRPLSRIVTLRSLSFENAHLGSDALVKIDDLEWIRPLKRLRAVWLRAVKLAQPDLSPLLALPDLEELHLSLRRDTRRQVREFASRSAAFARLEADFQQRERLSR